MKKSRLLYLHKNVNPGKVKALEALHAVYVPYVRLCVEKMLEERRYSLLQSEKQEFFPKGPKRVLSSQIVKNARAHAIQIVSTWAKSVYARKLRPTITNLRRDGTVTEEEAHALYVVGKHLIGQPWEFVTQDHIDAYHALLDRYGGRTPTVRDTIPMKLSIKTARLEDPKKARGLGSFWLRVSGLGSRNSIWLPLSGNPYIKRADQASKGISARKTKRGRWRFEVIDKSKKWKAPRLPRCPSRLAIDVGLNVLATDSEGNIYGKEFKPKFDKLYKRIRSTRANRFRQGLRENSPRLNRLESRLTGMTKTETGRIVNQLIRKNPKTLFIVEDLDLSGCKGQKRFAYRALQSSLEAKVRVRKINPAYTSQECPSCGYISRRNRSGIRFVCKSCGRKAHADYVGASGILRRSWDKVITCEDHYIDVKEMLRERFRLRRGQDSSSGSRGPSPPSPAPLPLGQRFTVGVPDQSGTGTASNSGLSDSGRF